MVAGFDIGTELEEYADRIARESYDSRSTTAANACPRAHCRGTMLWDNMDRLKRCSACNRAEAQAIPFTDGGKHTPHARRGGSRGPK